MARLGERIESLSRYSPEEATRTRYRELQELEKQLTASLIELNRLHSAPAIVRTVVEERLADTRSRLSDLSARVEEATATRLAYQVAREELAKLDDVETELGRLEDQLLRGDPAGIDTTRAQLV